MAGIPWPSLRTLCSIFCCPPLPSRIAAKLAFVPPECSYNFTSHMGRLRIRLGDFDEELTEHELDMIEPFTALTSRGETIACIFIRTIPHARFTILFSHGNAIDIGHMAGFLIFLADQLQCNILTYDYAGYGISTGSPSETNIYSDAEAVWQCLIHRFNISPENIILYGQSIGTAPTVDLAAKYEVGGVVLHSPLMSGMRMAFPNTKETWFFDAFPSIDKVEKIASVVLVIHGTVDEVIDFSHGEAIYKRCPRTVEPLWVQGAGHNDIENHREYIERLKTFINIEIPTS